MGHVRINVHQKHHTKESMLPDSFSSAEEANAWANGDGAQTLQDVFKQEFDNGAYNFTFDYL